MNDGDGHRFGSLLARNPGTSTPPDPTPDDEPEPGLEPDDGVRRRFPRLDLAQLLAADRPPRRWLLHGLIPEGASCSLVAPAGVGKSLLTLALAIAVARGVGDFAGLTIPQRRRVLLVDMENTTDDLADRFTALGITPDDVADLDHLVPIHLPALAALDTPHGALELDAIIDTYGIGPGDLVILDSFQRVTDGPENDSDTYRAFYRNTGIMLKRRGLTVLRLDNTGKDTEKGARGSSGKRDDVDLELLLTRDPQHGDQFTIKPGKARIPDISSITLRSFTDDDGLLTYSTAGDPWRARVNDAARALHAAGVPAGTGQTRAAQMVKAAGFKVTRDAVRVAVRERANVPDMRTRDRLRIATDTATAHPHADDPPHSPRIAPTETAESLQPQQKTHADDPPHSSGIANRSAHAPAMPPPPPSKGRHSGAHHPDNECQHHPGTPTTGAGCPQCAAEGRYAS